MEKLISKKLLTKVKAENLSESSRFISETKNVLAQRKKTSQEVSVFLSHKHGQTEILEEVIALLKKLGVSIYIDWQDYGIPPTTDGSTAIRIKSKIKENEKFILLATEEAIASKWCNWELGLGDAFKFPTNIAIIPITDTDDDKFSGSEYLQTYPIITSAYHTITGSYYVEYQGTKITLQNWLKQ